MLFLKGKSISRSLFLELLNLETLKIAKVTVDLRPVSFFIIGLQGTDTLLMWFISVNHQFYHKSESWIIEILRVNVDLYVER